MSASKLSEKVSALKAALETVRYQIKHLQQFYSREQIRCWRLQRDKLIAQLREFEPMLQAQQAQRELNKLSRKKSPTL